ncbi:PepSY domain-containing protein [Roseospira navarrensis]|uniref:PepSY domain-containing protein n=1 Tax=Roseospira navarrensis TaxID=140058 RepID=A0A7X2D3H7_9PROT|nr:PepSY domain-containing protein [Roseospira navarrensis]MQX35215.1 hypothetical protein [Roseospira navarrensis]
MRYTPLTARRTLRRPIRPGRLTLPGAVVLLACLAHTPALADAGTGYRSGDTGYDDGYIHRDHDDDDDDHDDDDGYRRGDDRRGDARPNRHGDGHDHDLARRLLEAGEIRSLVEIMAIVSPHLGGRMIDTEFEREDGRYVYEIKVVTPNGRLREVYVDAASGAIVKVEDD